MNREFNITISSMHYLQTVYTTSIPLQAAIFGVQRGDHCIQHTIREANQCGKKLAKIGAEQDEPFLVIE